MINIHRKLANYRYLLKFYQNETMKAKHWLDTKGKYHDTYSEIYINVYTDFKHNSEIVKAIKSHITEITD